MMAARTLSASFGWLGSRLCLLVTTLLGVSVQAATPHLEAGVQAVRESQMDVAAQQQLQNNQLNQSTTAPQGFNLQMQRTDKTPIKKSLDDLQFNVTEVDFDGNAVFSDATLQEYFATFINRPVSLPELNEVIETIEDKYKQAGYFLSRVYIPPQTLENGVLKVRVIEGYLSELFVEGGTAGNRAKITEVTEGLVNKKPLDLPSVEKAIRTLNAFPSTTVNAVLRQGAEIGASEMVLNVSQLPDYYSLSVNNFNAPAVGTWGASFAGTVNRLFDIDNQLSFSTSASLGSGSVEDFKRMLSFSAKYSQPIGNSGLAASLSYLYAQSQPVPTVADLNLLSQGTTVAPRLSYPVFSNRGNSLVIDSGITFSQTQTLLAATPFTNDKSTVFDITLRLTTTTWAQGISNLSIGYYQGLSGLGTSSASDLGVSVPGFNPSFNKFAFNLSRTQYLPNKFSVHAGAVGQYTTDSLLIANQISFGGPPIGRAYYYGAIMGDRGLGLFIELRKDVTFSDLLSQPIQFFAFADKGMTYVNTNETAGRVGGSYSLTSYGMGARTNFSKGSLELSYARGASVLNTIEPPPNNRFLFSGIYYF
jgi:hemolysin activation/secretion protein